MNMPVESASKSALVIPPVTTAAAPRGSSDFSPVLAAQENKWKILAFAMLMACLAYAGLRLVPPKYNASASVALDARQVQLMGAQSGLLASQITDEMWTRTQMEALSSPSLAAQVVRQLNLMDVPMFQTCPRTESVLAGLKKTIGLKPEPCVPSVEKSAQILLSNMVFFNDRQSYIIRITGTATDARLAADITNAYARDYVQRQRDMNTELTQGADQSLNAYLQQARNRMIEADVAVEQYRQEHSLVPLRAEPGTSASETLRSQSLSASNTELSSASAELASKQAQLGHVTALLRSGGSVAAVAPVLQSPVIQHLSEQHSALAQHLDDLRSHYGDSHPDVLAAQAAYDRSAAFINAEINKTVSSLQSEVAALAARRAALRGQVRSFETQVAGESKADVRLAELQREAQTEAQVYDGIMTRAKQIGAEQLLQRSSGQVVVEAVPADLPASPKKAMIVAGVFLASLGVGVGLFFARGMMSNQFRDAGQVEGETGVLVFGAFPRIRGKAPQDYVITNPGSPEAENVHNILAQLCGYRTPGAAAGQVALVTSAVAAEGKSTLAVTLGRSAGLLGLNVLVLDCNPANPSVGRMLEQGNTVAPLLGGAVTVDAIMGRINKDPRSTLHFLSLSQYLSGPKGILAWPDLAACLQQLRGRYDLIVLDAPAVLASADARYLAAFADRVLLTIDTQKTGRTDVMAALQALQRSGRAVSGAVLTKGAPQKGGAHANTGGMVTFQPASPPQLSHS